MNLIKGKYLHLHTYIQWYNCVLCKCVFCYIVTLYFTVDNHAVLSTQVQKIYRLEKLKVNMNFSRVICRKLQMKNNYHQWKIASRSLSSEHSADNKPEDKSSGYAKAFTKFEALKAEPKEEPKTFAALLRQSKFIEVNFIKLICVLYVISSIYRS